MRTARYRAIPSKLAVDCRLREKDEEGETSFAVCCSSPVSPRDSSPAGDSFSPRKEKERGDLYKELACPLDGFELLIFSTAGPDGKTFPLCPYCYNSPPFEGIDKLFGTLKLGNSGKIGKGAGMPCFLCPHPTCPHSLITQGVCACPECSGTLVLDPVSAPKWRLCCNMCNCLVSLPQGAHRISTTGKRCPECDSTIIEVDFNKKTTVLSDGATLHEGCILCDELLHSLVEVKHGTSFFRRGRGRGRNRGRGRHRGRGRGSSKHEDPKMSFRDF
ncbi:hypothetical protein BHM03_00014904 [Ensete ventricosum]|nr:hypothetical protein BHM03_00014904 [Ensete ventricosum]